MTETRTLQAPSRRSNFIESASRLDRIARPGEQNGGASVLQPASSRMAAVSPDEAWTKRFMSMGIGPQAAAPLAMPRPALKTEAAPAAMTAQPQKLAKPGKPQPIGAAIGKPVRRSLLGRMFRRD